MTRQITFNLSSASSGFGSGVVVAVAIVGTQLQPPPGPAKALQSGEQKKSASLSPKPFLGATDARRRDSAH